MLVLLLLVLLLLLALTGAAAQSKTALWLCACAQCCVDFFWRFLTQRRDGSSVDSPLSYIYTIIYTWTDLFWHILSQNWNTNLPGILMFNGKTKVFLSFFPSTDPLILKMGTLRSHFWICRFNDEGYYQYSSSNLLVLGREWMGCWGLLGWLLLVIMDHSRKFHAFSTSKPKRVNTCENYYWCCLKIGKPASPESIG